MSLSDPSADALTRSNRIQKVANDCLVRRAAGEALSYESITEKYPELMPELGEWLRAVDVLRAVAHERSTGEIAHETMKLWCPNCETSVGVNADDSLTHVSCQLCGRQFDDSVDEPFASEAGSSNKAASIPERIGRYRIRQTLGHGAFGRVLLADDEELRRKVAIKVPHPSIVAARKQASAHLAEARAVASLDHPNIVPVHDVGSSDEYPCYLVCKYISGSPLSAQLKQGTRLTYKEAAELVATLSEALHYAHTQGVVHRDIKPSNILIASDHTPYLADFGLALREEDFGAGPRYVGTPAYMSPEQARGEGHRVDGRSDIFSLGVVLYELLAGRRPFRGASQAELFEQLIEHEPPPLKKHRQKIPKELERICQRAMAKRVLDRYVTARDVADDLRQFLAELSETDAEAAVTSTRSVSLSATEIGSDSSLDGERLMVVPKGLRAFDAHDANFFLQLLPGPRDRHGLPDGVRFWKTRIEEFDPDETFSLGLIYGPSGSGKSSLVKAGLLPNLSEDVIPIYVEATSDSTETRLTTALHTRCNVLDRDLALPDALTMLRRGPVIPPGKKILIVLDQFEQWLHGKRDEQRRELVRTLRQCDGGRVQCILMVRDDFWMSVTRFLRELEVRLLEDHNLAAVDRFPERHARKVLAAFGRALGSLPERQAKMTRSQNDFLTQSVSGLTEEGKVNCVRLSLFAEMMKDKSWDLATFKKTGGTEGIGVTFLEETFSSSTASPGVRFHQNAARAVLKALLPDGASEIKGHMRSFDELLHVSGYRSRRKDFDELIKILDNELRLITPTDPEGIAAETDGDAKRTLDGRYYQLTHDYLVQPLRTWLTQKQKETYRGRAALRLSERARIWNARPEKRHLPSLWEYANIRLLTRSAHWTEPQREMIKKATSVLALRWSLVFVALLLIGSVLQYKIATDRHLRVERLIASLHTERGVMRPDLTELDEYPKRMVVRELGKQFVDSPTLPLAFGLAYVDDVRGEFLVREIRSASAEQMTNFVDAFRVNSSAFTSAISSLGSLDEIDVRYKARLAAIGLQLDYSRLANEMCQFNEDPTHRTVFIDECSQWHGDLSKLATIATAGRDDVPLRTALASAVANVERVSDADRDAWDPVLRDWHANEPDKLTHSVAGLVLRKWYGDQAAKPVAPSKDREWYVNSAGMTMVMIPSGAYVRRDRADGELREPKPHQLPKIVDQKVVMPSFWLSPCEVTLEQFEGFMKAESTAEKSKTWKGPFTSFGDRTAPSHPVDMVSWYDAVLYCNWLSEVAGFEKCYERTNETETIGSTLADVWRCDREVDGYRLPTEAEWRYAYRAGTTTDFHFGNQPTLLDRYAVFRCDRPMPVGSKLPNAWGLFDMNGNVNEWSHDWLSEFGEEPIVRDPVNKRPVKPESRFKLHLGGPAEVSRILFFRADRRWGMRPLQWHRTCGFRVARTIR